ncbi:synaptophysin-like protein 1 [Corticium candelabrum]|uniref:synaptophysin-like protein 1 n=1 Tax=Corticium candelabrum TaxID=121492 RepID=UPI002E370119|nr:synaptophysin-like protein 1 [Corticium candelabrum]
MAGKILSLLKQPRGYLKLFETIAAILTLALTCSFSSQLLVYHVDNPNERFIASLRFPFASPVGSFNDTEIPVYLNKFTISIDGSIRTGGIAMALVTALALTVGIVFFCIYCSAQEDSQKIAIWDVFTNCVVGFAVAIVMIGWSVQFGRMTDQVENWVDVVFYNATNLCKPNSGEEVPCATEYPNYAPLIVGLVFGYLAAVAWLVNVWFVYKNTYLHKYEILGSSGRGGREVAGGRTVTTDTGAFRMTGAMTGRGSQQRYGIDTV